MSNAATASDPKKIYLGRYYDAASGTAEAELPYPGERHLILCGPNGCGKGTSVLIPNLLRLQDRSIIVIDPKGELAAVTARYRRTVSDVVILNPFGVLGIPSSSFNPLASLDPDSDLFLDDATGVGEALIKIEEKDPHWSESAQGLIVALVMWEVQRAKKERRLPTLQNVRRLLTEPIETEEGADGKQHALSGLRHTVRLMQILGGFEIESLAGRFLRQNDEIASIQSTADRQTAWMLSRPMRANLEANDVDFCDLKKRPMTVYVILPAERMRTHSVWLRLVIVTALRALYTAGGLKTLFILDEFAQLGRLGPIEDAFGLVRGYGVQLWPVLQDFNQLKSLYLDRWETFTGNAGIVQAFGPNDLFSADWMSRRAGETTVVVSGFNKGGSSSARGQSSSDGMNYQQNKRRLFLPQELMDFRKGSGIVWPAGTSRSIPFYGPPYWKVPEFDARADPNPYRPQ